MIKIISQISFAVSNPCILAKYVLMRDNNKQIFRWG